MNRRRPLNEVSTAVNRPAPRRRSKTHRAPVNEATTPSRRVRSPRHGVRRATLVAMVTLALAATVALGAQWLVHQSFLRVQHVTFVGLRHESAAKVLIASGLDAHPTMYGVSATAIERNLKGFSWIDGVRLAKHWPSTVVVTVHETTAVAVAWDGHHVLQYVDAAGRDLGVAPLHVNLPTLQYLNPTSSSWPYERAGSASAYVASQLPIAFKAQVSVVTVDHQGHVALKMTTPVSFVLGPATQLRAKFVAIASVIAHTTLRPGDVVDVTVPDELAVSGPAPS